MNNEDIEKLVHMNQRLLLVIGFGTAIMTEMMNEIENRLNPTEVYQNNGYEWFLQCVDNLVYLDKPLPPIPSKD